MYKKDEPKYQVAKALRITIDSHQILDLVVKALGEQHLVRDLDHDLHDR